MRARSFAFGVWIGTLLTAAFALAFRGPGGMTRPRPKMFVGGFMAAIQLAKPETILQNCPEPRLAFDAETADYSLWMRWEQNHWNGSLFGKDGTVLFHEDSSDSNQLIRDACKSLWQDLRWPGPPDQQRNATDRFDLRDLHNGPVSTSAIIDRKTGKVWVWERDKDGGTVFMSEHVIPEPEHDE